MLALSVVLVALIQGVFSDCPEIRNNERRAYPVGSTLEVNCPGTTGRTYIVTCTDTDLWDYSLLARSCSGTVQAGPSTVAPPPPIATTTAPSARICPYIPGFMRAADAGKTYPQGVVYDMICSSNGGTFPATCENEAWVYVVNSCPGITQPLPPTPTPSVVLPPVTATSSPGACPYLSGYMEESAMSISFGEGDRYQMACNPPNQPRRFDAICQNGQWYGNVESCTGTGTGTGLFGNLFNRRPAAPATTAQPGGDLRPCVYISELMLDTDAGKTFPHGVQYYLRCVDPNSVSVSVLATCIDGTWSYDPNECFRRPSILQRGLQIGNTNIPLLYFLLG